MPVANTNVYRRRDDDVTEIITRKGDVFLIDTADESVARRHCWSLHEHGYARAVTRVDGCLKTIYLHRLLLPTTPERPHVDHANGNQGDCRRANIRPCTRSENLRNQKLRTDSRSGFKGVGLHAPTGKYRARARANGIVVDGGLFDTPEEAFAVAARRRNQLHGEFARHE